MPKLDSKQQLAVRDILVALREAAGDHERSALGLGASSALVQLEGFSHEAVCDKRGYCRVLQDGLRAALELDAAH